MATDSDVITRVLGAAIAIKVAESVACGAIHDVYDMFRMTTNFVEVASFDFVAHQ